METSPLYTVAQLRELDRLAIEALDGDSFALMTHAASAAFRRLRARWPEARRLVVLCGRGNNGGDGYVLARLAREAGLETRVFRLAAEDPGTPDTRRARETYVAASGNELVFDPAIGITGADVIVDGLFGLGLTRAPDAATAALIEAVNAAAVPVLALDLPSGLDADTGATPGACVRAALTVTFIGGKRGLVTGRAAAFVGDLVLEPLDVTAKIRGQVTAEAMSCGDDVIRSLLEPRQRTAHKGDFGHVLVIGGDHGYGGAARLSAEAAARSGAGLVSVATRTKHVAAMLASRPELMVQGVTTAHDLAHLLERADVIAVGPGLGQGGWGRTLFGAALTAGKPLVVDADALSLLTATPTGLPASSIITPHPGEAARLLGTDARSIQADRYAAAAALAHRYDCVAVLKGAGTIVATRDGTFDVSTTANPGMASGGMGDVLTGVIAALLAQGLKPRDAARVGVAVHARAAAIAAGGAERGMLAGDVLGALRAAVNP